MIALTLTAALAALPSGPLAALDAALERLGTGEPIRARFTHRYSSSAGDGADAVRTEGEVSGEVAEGPAGLEITWPRALVERARAEERQRGSDPEARTPVRDGIAAVNTMELARLLDGAAVLREALDGASLVEDRPDVVDGAPARLLVLKLSPHLSARDRRYVKEVESRLRLWLGADGLPLAAEAEAKLSGRAFLVITFKSEQRERWRFERAAGRLVTVRHEEERHGEGAGDRGDRTATTTLQLQP
jgi:hypothetical protein